MFFNPWMQPPSLNRSAHSHIQSLLNMPRNANNDLFTHTWVHTQTTTTHCAALINYPTDTWFEKCSADSCFYMTNPVTLVKQTSYSATQSACQKRLLQGGCRDEVSDALSPILLGKLVMAALQNQLWNLKGNVRHVRHRKVNCCQSSYESCPRWLQQRRLTFFRSPG